MTSSAPIGLCGAGESGWWIATEIDVVYDPHDVYRHDVAGWRKARVAVARGRVLRHPPAGYLVVTSVAPGQVMRLEPFEQVELEVSRLFGDIDEGEAG